MFILYVFIYPFCSLMLAILAVNFFPFAQGQSVQWQHFSFFIFQFVDYLLALFMLLFCFVLLRRTFRRSLAFLVQLPLSLWKWTRNKHLIPILFSFTIVLYLLIHMSLHTVAAIGLAVFWEWVSPDGRHFFPEGRIPVAREVDDKSTGKWFRSTHNGK